MRTVARAALALLVVAGLIAAAVWAVVTVLGPRAITASNSCTAYLPDGTSHALTSEQADNAALISAIATSRSLPGRAATIALATAMQESRLENIDYGDRDSIGLFQQRPSQGWGTVEEIMDPVYSTGAFFDQLVHLDGYETMEITVAAQRIQRSAFPDAYAQHEGMARAFASSLMGHSPAALTCDLPTSEADGVPDAVAQRLERDFGSAPMTGGGERLAIDATNLATHVSAETASWAVGHWAVATASETGVQGVRVGDQEWLRGTREWASVSTEAPTGTVFVW